MVAGIQANAYKSDNSTADYVNPLRLDENLRKHLYDQEMFRFLGKTDTSQLNVAGRGKQIDIEGSWSVNALTEAVETPVSAWSVSQVTIEFNAYGDAKQFTEEQLVKQISDVTGNFMYNANSAFGINRDNVIVTTLMTTTTTGYYPNAHDDTTVVSTDTLGADDIRKLIRDSKGTQAGGLKGLVLHPNVVYDLTGDDKFLLAQNDARVSAEISATGFAGSLYGLPIFESNRIQTATENSVTVYKNILLGNNEPFIFMPKKAPVYEFDPEYSRARAMTFHYWEMFGVGIVISDSVKIVNCTASD